MEKKKPFSEQGGNSQPLCTTALDSKGLMCTWWNWFQHHIICGVVVGWVPRFALLLLTPPKLALAFLFGSIYKGRHLWSYPGPWDAISLSTSCTQVWPAPLHQAALPFPFHPCPYALWPSHLQPMSWQGSHLSSPIPSALLCPLLLLSLLHTSLHQSALVHSLTPFLLALLLVCWRYLHTPALA